MSLLWPRPAHEGAGFSPDERRVREFLDAPGGVSESVESLAAKLGITRGNCRRVLDQLVKEGFITRTEFADIAPMYYRYPARDDPGSPRIGEEQRRAWATI